jgi:hypothetical protein
VAPALSCGRPQRGLRAKCRLPGCHSEGARSRRPRVGGTRRPARQGAAHRLDDPFSQFLAERGADRVSLESVGALVVAATHVRLAAYLAADVGASVRRASEMWSLRDRAIPGGRRASLLARRERLFAGGRRAPARARDRQAGGLTPGRRCRSQRASNPRTVTTTSGPIELERPRVPNAQALGMWLLMVRSGVRVQWVRTGLSPGMRTDRRV